MPKLQESLTVSVRQAAKLVGGAKGGVSEQTVRQWLKEGLPHIRTGAKGGRVRIIRSEIDPWLKARATGGEEG